MANQQAAPFKVGDRVDYWQEAEGWKSGRILGRDALNQWIVKLDGDVPYKNFRVKDSDAVELLRHSTAPAPDPKPRPRAGYMPEGELARQLEAAKQFKTGDHIALRFPQDSDEQTGTIASMDSKSFSFQPDNGFARGYFLNALAFARKIDTPDQDDEDDDPILTAAIMHDFYAGVPGFEVVNPEPRKSYEPKPGDLITRHVNGECDTMRVIEVGERSFSAVFSDGQPFRLITATFDKFFERGDYRIATRQEKIAYLQADADRLDDLAAQAIEDRAKVMAELAALKAAQE